MHNIKAGIIGGAGYTGGELLRLLVLHPHVEIAFVQSSSNAGNPVHQVHTDLLGETSLIFSEKHHAEIDVLFLCGGHGAAQKFLSENDIPEKIAVIDLSHDFRLQKNNSIAGRNFVYGLPELNKEKIITAKSIANPGCFATCIQLALLPLAQAGLLQNEIHVNATTGSTGAGQALSATTHFTWRNNNISVYKAFTHQHFAEIEQSLHQLQQNFSAPLHFIPQRGNFTRGILSSAYMQCEKSETEVKQLFKKYFQSEPFIRISETNIDLKQVVNTNRCFIHIEKQGDQLLIISAIDNLLKGASGQAVQNMNLLFGFNETAGLQLKPSAL